MELKRKKDGRLFVCYKVSNNKYMILGQSNEKVDGIKFDYLKPHTLEFINTRFERL